MSLKMSFRLTTVALATAALPAFAEPITVEHARGTLTLENAPSKVLVSDINTLDNMLALGVEPAGVPLGNMRAHLAAFEDPAKYIGVGSLFEPDVEAIAAAEADLYIIGGRSAKAYETVEGIVPTIDLSQGERNNIQTVRDNVTLLGGLFGKEEKAAELVATLDTEIAEAKAAAEGKGTALILVTNAGKLGAYGPASRLGWLHTELGLQPLEENIDDRFHGGDVISFEYILEKNPDYVFVVDRDQATGGEADAAKALLDNELFNQTNAAKEGHVVYLDPYSSYITSAGYNSLITLANQIEEGLNK